MKLISEHLSSEVLSHLQEGDLHVFDRIYELYSHKLFLFIFGILKNDAESEDIVQEVFIKIWETREKFDDSKILNSYIFTIAYHKSIDLVRKRINNSIYLDQLKKSSLPENSSIITDIEYEEMSQRAEKYIINLPERQKQVYLLHQENGLTYSEIAERLGISKNTVGNHMVKALKCLHQNLDRSL